MSSLGSSMEDLTENVMVDILSRLPVKTIINCKCVCNKWRNLVLDSYFVNLHLSRSPPGLMIHHRSEQERTSLHEPGVLKWLEIEDEVDHRDLHHDPVMSLDLNLAPIFQKSAIRPVGSVNGLICLWQNGPEIDNTYICNPITREYVILPRQQYYRQGYRARIVYGFGVSSLTGKYKVMRTFQRHIPLISVSTSRPSPIEAEVYTLGTGQWRSLGHAPCRLNELDGPFLNGHVHWIVLDRESPEKICAFDFDKETFQLFPSPPYEAIEDSDIRFQCLGVLKGCLCQSDIHIFEFTIWVMKEYGIKKSWQKEVVIKQSISIGLHWLFSEPLCFIEDLKDETLTIEDRLLFGIGFTGMAYRPSFLKLQNFELERVNVF